MYSALDALNSLTGSYLVDFVRTIDVYDGYAMSRIAR